MAFHVSLDVRDARSDILNCTFVPVSSSWGCLTQSAPTNGVAGTLGGFRAPACEFRCGLPRHPSSLGFAGLRPLLGSSERLSLVGFSLFPEETLCQDRSV